MDVIEACHAPLGIELPPDKKPVAIYLGTKRSGDLPVRSIGATRIDREVRTGDAAVAITASECDAPQLE